MLNFLIGFTFINGLWQPHPSSSLCDEFNMKVHGGRSSALKKNLNFRLSFGKAALMFCSSRATTCLYSGTPSYEHPVYKTTSLLRPYSFQPNVKTIESFYYFEDPINATTSLLQPGFYGPTVVALTGFHCISLCFSWRLTFLDTCLEVSFNPLILKIKI